MDVKFVAAGALAVIVTLVAIFSLRPLAPRLGLVDKPNGRKHHRGRVPLIGGICFFLGTIAGLTYFGYMDRFVVCLLATGALIVLTGLIDDLDDISVRSRLLVQACAAGLVIAATGIYIDGGGRIFGTEELRLYALGIPVTIVAVIGLINAFNMLDGIDGLAGGMAMVSIVSILTFTSASWPTLGVALLLQILSIALIPYLFVNLGWPDGRRIFMGDAGSTLIGFLLAWSLIYLSHRNVARLAPVDVLWCIALPIMDTLAVMYRRARKGLSPFRPDRQHLHHLMLDAGFSAREALALIVGAGSLLAGAGYALRGLPDLISLAAFAVALTCYVLWLPRVLDWLRVSRSRPLSATNTSMSADMAAEQALVLKLGSGQKASAVVSSLLSGSRATTVAPADLKAGAGGAAVVGQGIVKALCVLDASPDDIKMAPIVQLLSRDDRFEAQVCVTAAPSETSVQVLNLFGIRSDPDPNIMRVDSISTDIASATLGEMERVLNEFQPDVVLVHGDTPTTLATALAAYYQKIPLAHVETGSPGESPEPRWPDEANRKIINTLASLHLTSTERTGRDLAATGVPEDRITITGATTVDTLYAAMEGLQRNAVLRDKLAQRFSFLRMGSPLLLACNRGCPDHGLTAIDRALQQLAMQRPDVDIVYAVRSGSSQTDRARYLRPGHPNIHLVEPLDYLAAVYLLNSAYLVLAGPGDIQEEAGLLGKPVLAVRGPADGADTMIDRGNVHWVNMDENEVIGRVITLLTDESAYEAMRLSSIPGDNNSSAVPCIVEALANLSNRPASLAA